MQVILLESIEGLGRKGAQVEVKGGFARNYLLPQRKAMRINKDTMFRLESLRKRFAAEEEALLSEMKVLGGRMEGLSIQLVMKATEEGHLFGSVTAATIAKELAERDFTVRERAVKLGETIKDVGTYPVDVHLHDEVIVPVTVVVDAEGRPEDEEEAAEDSEAVDAETEEAPTES